MVRAAERRLAVAELVRARLLVWIVLLVIQPSIPAGMVVGVLLASGPVEKSALTGSGTVLGFVAGYLMIALAPRMRRRFGLKVGVARLTLAAFAAVILSAWLVSGAFAAESFYPRYPGRTPPSDVGYVTNGVASGLTGALVILIALAGIVLIAVPLMQRRYDRHCADSRTLLEVGRVIQWLDGDLERFRDLDARREMALRLENAAESIGLGLARIRAIGTVVWSAVAGFVPLGIVLTLDRQHIQLPRPLDTAAVAVAALWAFASVLMLIDPMFNARMSAVRDLYAVLRGSAPVAPAKSP